MADTQPGIKNVIDYSRRVNQVDDNNQFDPMKEISKNLGQFRPLDKPERRDVSKMDTFRNPNLDASNDDGSPEEIKKAFEESQKPQVSELGKIETNTKSSSDLGIMSNILSKEQSLLLTKISMTLATLSDRLESKYETEMSQPLQTSEPTTLESLQDDEPVVEEEKKPTVAPENRLFTETPKESNKLLDDEKSGKEFESQKDAVQRDGFEAVVGTLKTGFKTSVSAVDKVGNFLFKTSLKQAVEAAKIAAAIFAIIVAIDVIRAYWSVWGDSILAKIDEWKEVFSEWWQSFTDWATSFSDVKNVFETMGANLMEIKTAWATGDFPALGKAIFNALVDFGKTLQAVFARAVAGVLAPLLRKIGFSGAADELEAYSLRVQQNNTDSKLSDENQRKLSANQIKKEDKDGKTGTERGITDFLPAKWRNKMWMLSDAEYGQVQAEQKDTDKRKSLSYEDRLANTSATNEARESLERYKKYAEAANPLNKSDLAKVDKYKKESQEYLANKSLALTPETKKELDRQFNEIKVRQPPQVKPQEPSESDDQKIIQKIRQNEVDSARKEQAQNNVANVQTNVTKNSRTINVQSPVTSTRAPGIHNATGVN